MPFEHDEQSTESRPRRPWQRLPLVSLATAAALLLVRIPILPRRSFDPDEFEHAHAAWALFQGTLPYRDFFEHHTPWYYYALYPFFKWFDVDASFESAKHFLLFGRGLSLVLTALSVLLVFCLGRLWQDRRTGVVAGLLLVAQPVFLQKTIEMRPDVLALPFFLASLWCLLRGLERGASSRPPGLRWFLGAGLALGTAVMCTQKMLFVLPGALAGLGIWALSADPRTKTAARGRIALILVFLLGISAPAALTWAAFAHQHAGRDFITDNFLLNARWKHFATHQLRKVLLSSAPVVALALAGVAASLSRLLNRPRDLLLIGTMVGLFAGVTVVPAAHRQYYMMPLPIVCLFAARGLFILIDRARERLRPLLLGVAALGLAVLPAISLHEAFRDSNSEQLAKLHTVYETTAPSDLVMDGWQGMGVFRPHAFFYFFLHEETRAMLPAERLNAYLDDLEGGRVRPRLIALDENLRALGPRFVTFVETRYVSSDGFFYLPPRGH